jgi:hypothetical protein
MHFPSTILIAATALLSATTVSAVGCYSGGKAWPSKDVAYENIYNACHGYTRANGEHVQGAFGNLHFKKNSEAKLPATACVNSIGYKIDFAITNKGDALTVNADECNSGLGDAVSCVYGGRWIRSILL